MKAMILAAGRGERMRPLTDETPKALLVVRGRALIEHHLAALKAAGIKDVVINVAWLGAQIIAQLGDGSRHGMSISYSDEGDRALETGGGIANALPLLGSEPFWIVNGDVYADYDFTAQPLGQDIWAHLLVVPNPDHNPAGDFALRAGTISNDGEPRYTYSGIAIVRPELIAGHAGGAFPLAPYLRRAADQGALTGELLNSEWVDVGTPARLRALG